MRLSMMPTAKKKLGAIGLFARTGGDSSPRAGVVGLPATPAPASALSGKNHPLSSSHAPNNAQQQQQQQQLQPPHEIVATTGRQQDKRDTPATATAASRSIPVPKVSSGRYSSVAPSAHHHSQPPPTSMSMSLPAQHFHPMQRTRTSASDTATREPPRAQNAWEDSTVASMFNDTESRAASDRTHTRQTSHGRQYNTDGAGGPPATGGAYQRQHQTHPPLPAPPQTSRRDHQHHQTLQHQQQHGPTNENLPFVIGDNGMLTVIAPPHHQSVVPVTSSTAANIPLDSDKADDVYHDDRAIYETPTKNNALRRTRLPYRDTRELKDVTYSPSGSQYSPRRAESVSMSPERAVEAGEHLEQVRIEERRKRDRERQRERERELERQRERELEQERELQYKRSTIFENLTPLEFDDDHNFNDTRAGVLATTSGVDPDELTEALQRTPRAATRKLPPPVLPLPLAVKKDVIATAAVAAPLGRTNSTNRRIIKEPSKPSTKSLKRRLSLDYNDAELHRMSYSDLRNQAFDYDPLAAAAIEQQTAAKQQQPPPHPGGSIEQRMEYYKNQGSLDQHQFFTRISVDEWDEAGDWFLEQFGAVMQKFKKARKDKRQLIAQFEDEISAREEAVRGKIDGIGRTLEDLKHEGQTMMQGKDADLDF
ncbi:extracellular mutant protein 11-domain-containing protein [Apiosordaria backusii]|uniref:Extracellular mutant protein 11-domain-containing protein n=1 Tax=Apiosordaria backusii TaxID=314023 RepID=A0AA40DQY5_9PEZI|nr:extracellular mutant protein 11-domain-containing protein [Apiosordaria backusii]